MFGVHLDLLDHLQILQRTVRFTATFQNYEAKTVPDFCALAIIIVVRRYNLLLIFRRLLKARSLSAKEQMCIPQPFLVLLRYKYSSYYVYKYFYFVLFKPYLRTYTVLIVKFCSLFVTKRFSCLVFRHFLVVPSKYLEYKGILN